MIIPNSKEIQGQIDVELPLLDLERSFIFQILCMIFTRSAI